MHVLAAMQWYRRKLFRTGGSYLSYQDTFVCMQKNYINCKTGGGLEAPLATT